MNVFHLESRFKRYALYERGMRVPSYKAIWSEVCALATFTATNQLSTWTTAVVRAYLIEGRMSKDWSAKTFRNKWQSLKSFLDWCVREAYIDQNPIKAITRPKLGARLPRCLSPGDAKKLLASALWYPWRSPWERARNLAILATLMMTGVRLSELLLLGITDVDTNAGLITVHHGKGNKERMIPIYPRLMPILCDYHKQKQLYGKPSQWFFTGLHSSKRLYPKDVRRICKTISKTANVMFTPHMLRHTFARELADNNMDVMKIKELLGHAQVTTTQMYIAVSMRSMIKSINDIRMYR